MCLVPIAIFIDDLGLGVYVYDAILSYSKGVGKISQVPGRATLKHRIPCFANVDSFHSTPKSAFIQIRRIFYGKQTLKQVFVFFVQYQSVLLERKK